MAQESKQHESQVAKGKLTTLEHNCYKQFADQFSQGQCIFDVKVPFQGHYIGPIEFTRTNDRGRAWVAKQDIEAGTLLLAEKAYIFSSRKHHGFGKEYLDNLSKTMNATIKDEMLDELEFDETVLLVSKLIDLLLKVDNPSQIVKDIKALYPREHEMEDFEKFHLSDFDICNDQDIWLFNHYMLKLENHLSHDKTALSKFDIRMSEKHHFIKRIPWIVYYNAMVIEQNVELLCYDRLFSDYTGDGLYIKTSFFNHDCEPNCTRIYIGDICIVRTIKDIKSKEECCFSYIANEYLCENYRIRNFQLPFECLCDKCINERTIHFEEQKAGNESLNDGNNNNDGSNNNDNNDSNESNNSSNSSLGDNENDIENELKESIFGSSHNSNASKSKSRIESDYDSEAEGQEMVNYEEHRIFTMNVASKLFEIENAKERINEINKLLGILNKKNKNKSMKEIEFSVSNRNELNNIVHRDFLEGYTAKAMSYLELKEWELAHYSFEMCLNDIKKVQGSNNETVIVYATQCLLCYLAMMNDKNDNDNNNNNSVNDELLGKQKELLKYILSVHQVCFGSDFRLYRMRYDLEIANAHYPKEIRDSFWPFVEKHI